MLWFQNGLVENFAVQCADTVLPPTAAESESGKDAALRFSSERRCQHRVQKIPPREEKELPAKRKPGSQFYWTFFEFLRQPTSSVHFQSMKQIPKKRSFVQGPTISSAPSVEHEDYRTPKPSFDLVKNGKSFDFGGNLPSASDSNALVKVTFTTWSLIIQEWHKLLIGYLSVSLKPSIKSIESWNSTLYSNFQKLAQNLAKNRWWGDQVHMFTFQNFCLNNFDTEVERLRPVFV